MIEFGTRLSEDGSELLYYEIMDGVVDERSMKGTDGRNKVLLALTERHGRKEAQRFYDEILRLARDLPTGSVVIVDGREEGATFGFGDIGDAESESRFPLAEEAIEAARRARITPPL